MTITGTQLTIILAVVASAGMLFALTPPIVQDPAYHAFADSRTLFGLSNFWNVLSNISFLIAAVYGLRALRSRTAFSQPWERRAYCIVLAGTMAVAIGSSYYHLRPDDQRLFWDRLPMAVVFMTIVASVIGERISSKTGQTMLLPLILFGAASVVYWRWSGDLRPYVLVQFGAMLALPVLFAFYPPRYTGSGWMWMMGALYLLAKGLEAFDGRIGAVLATGGHPWKHLAAAGAMFVYVHAVAGRRPLS